MDKKNNPNNIGHNKKSLLSNPVEHIDIKSFDARKIIDGMGKMSFTSRDTARAAGIYNEMLADKLPDLISSKSFHAVVLTYMNTPDSKMSTATTKCEIKTGNPVVKASSTTSHWDINFPYLKLNK